MTKGKVMNFDAQPRLLHSRVRRAILLGLVSAGVFSALAPAALADKLSCAPVQRMTETSNPA